MVEVPGDEAWFSEIKLDGYRFLAWNCAQGVRMITRNGHDWTSRLPAVAARIAALPADVILDGELVALNDTGVSSFAMLQAALSAGQDSTLHFYAFDLLSLDGWDLRACALRERKRLLLGMDGWSGHLRYSDHIEGEPGPLYRKAVALGLEGIVCKRNRPYHAGRGDDWVKVKILGREEMIVLGWTPPRGARTGIGALHLGYHDPRGRLHYAGAVGSGFTDSALAEWQARLAPIATHPPVGMLLAGDQVDQAIQWVKPRYIVEVAYTAWSGSGRLRHAVLLERREDKSAKEVVRDIADPEAPRQVFVASRMQTGSPDDRPIAIPPRRRRPLIAD